MSEVNLQCPLCPSVEHGWPEMHHHWFLEHSDVEEVIWIQWNQYSKGNPAGMNLADWLCEVCNDDPQNLLMLLLAR